MITVQKKDYRLLLAIERDISRYHRQNIDNNIQNSSDRPSRTHQRSSNAWPTFSMRGTILISRLDIRWLPKALSCVFRTFCSPKTGSIWNPQSMWTTAKNISLSAKCMPGQMRRLRNVVRWTVHNVNTVYTPSAKSPVVTFPWILRVHGFRRRDIVLKISLWLKDHCKDYFSYSQRKNLPWMCADLDIFEDHGA